MSTEFFACMYRLVKRNNSTCVYIALLYRCVYTLCISLYVCQLEFGHEKDPEPPYSLCRPIVGHGKESGVCRDIWG